MPKRRSFDRWLLLTAALLAFDEPPQVGHVVHGTGADLHAGQLASAAQVVHGLATQPAQQPTSFTLVHEERRERGRRRYEVCRRFSEHDSPLSDGAEAEVLAAGRCDTRASWRCLVQRIVPTTQGASAGA